MARRKPRQPVRRNPAEPINRKPVEEVIPPDLLDFLTALRQQAGPSLDEGFGGFEGSLPGMERGVPGFLPGERIGQPIPYPGGGGQYRLHPMPGGDGGEIDPGFNIQPDPPGFLPGETMGPMRPYPGGGPPQQRPFPGAGPGNLIPLPQPIMGGGRPFPTRGKPMRGFPHPSTYGGGFPARRPF